MANSGAFKDPLSFGAEDDLEDLTAALESGLEASSHKPRADSSDDYDNSADLPGGTSSMAPYINADPVSMDAFASYGQLVRPPPTYEQTSMYHTVSLQSPSSGEPSSSLAPSTSTAAPAGAPATPAAAFAADDLELQPGQTIITVTDPQKREQSTMFGIKSSYVAYLVTTRTGTPSGKKETAVRRRFNDVVSLADVIKYKYRGYFVPPRPEKNAVEGSRASEAFVEERRQALQRYLTKLARHPVIKNSEALKMFLEHESDLTSSHQWQSLQPPQSTVLETTAKFSMQLLGRESSVVDPVAAAQPTSKGTDLMRALKEQAQSMRTVAYDGDEARLRVVRDGMEGLREALVGATRGAELMVRKMDREGSVLGDLGLALFKIAKLEEGAGGTLAVATGTLRNSTSMVNDTKRVATALVRLARLSKKVVSRTALELSQLHEYLGAMPGILKGLGAREKQLLTAETLEADLETRKRVLVEAEAAGSKSVGGSEKAAKRVNDIKFEISQLELSIGAAKNEYDKIKNANMQELERVKVERQQDWMLMVHNMALVQASAASRSAEVWLQLASELGAPPEQVAEIRAVVASASGPEAASGAV